MNTFVSPDNLTQDIRFALRQILRSPAFACIIAIFTVPRHAARLNPMR